MKSLSIFTLSLVLLMSAQKGTGQQNKTSIDSFIEKRMAETGLVGAGAAILINKEIAWTKGYGYADKDNKIPFTPNTIMNIASITKTITGVCMMQAVEEKKLSLDEDINTYLPFKVVNPYFPDEKITLRNLATHTSGLADRYPFYDSTYYYSGDTKEPLGEFLKNYYTSTGKYYSKENFLQHKPGTFREYSNIAAGLAGYIVELATGEQLNVYSRRRIFKPLKMDNTGWFLSEVNLADHSKLYDKQGDTTRLIPLYSVPTYPDGGVRTSVAELAKFFACLLNDGSYKGARILKKKTTEEMQRFQFTAENKPENVNPEKLNSGIFWATKMNATRIGHSGTDPGVKTEMLALPSKEIGIVLFTNTTLSEANMKKYVEIMNELFKYGETLKNNSAGR